MVKIFHAYNLAANFFQMTAVVLKYKYKYSSWNQKNTLFKYKYSQMCT